MNKQDMHPFTLSEYENEYSLLLFNDMKWDIFEALGFLGNGHDWTRLIEALIQDKSPETMSNIKFDSEADMFCVRSESMESLHIISELVSKFYDDDKLMEEAISKYAQYH